MGRRGRHEVLVLVWAVQALTASVLPGTSAATVDKEPEPRLPLEDAVRIAETFRLADAIGEGVWPGWSDAPRALLLVTRDREFLVHHPEPGKSFAAAGFDSVVASDVYVRDRVFDPRMQATFPAVGGIPTVVIGQPRRTDASHSTRWILTALHEHFHQWQQSRPGYYTGVNALGLARGDTTGTWMLDYDFPYDRPEIEAAFSELCEVLLGVVSGVNPLQRYLDAKEAFRKRTGSEDYRYFEFQLWQEGIARYTEIKLARLASLKYRPSAAFIGLPDFMPFAAVADEMERHVMTRLSGASLSESKRVAFYAVGAAEGIALDRVAPEWQSRYMDAHFSTDVLFRRSER